MPKREPIGYLDQKVFMSALLDEAAIKWFRGRGIKKKAAQEFIQQWPSFPQALEKNGDISLDMEGDESTAMILKQYFW